jgi:5-methylcytosine-specific restriction enzyme A
MPFKSKKPCSYPGCSELVSSSYCEKHQKIHDESREIQRRQSGDIHRSLDLLKMYDRKWKKRRAVHLTSHPWCEDCMSRGIYEPATEVHHMIPHKGDQVLFMTSPLLSLCKPCHSSRTNRANRKGQGEGGY